ncbi:branched-chain amino acid ABC transporter permease [Marisediminicola senii]|uniref:branched-chain amino acid ABC transporter permease n=1 Tax=Marisediminicola senii TaxID=2711233 RepID=UPI001F40F522|nr:branched-chain amino acid ABC transporter permease [Marisediminicola senii]
MLAVLMGLSPASAATSPSPEPSPSGDFTSTFTIGGLIRDGDTPIEGVEVQVEGDGFDEVGVTGEDGRWTVPVPGPGAYTATLLPDTLPEGIVPRDPENITRDVTLGTTNTVNVLFPTGEGTVVENNIADTILTRFIYGLNFGLLLALGAIGISLIYGTTKLNNFAHGEMVTFGAVIFFFFGTVIGLPLYVSIPIALALSAFTGYAQDAWLHKPLRRRGVGLVQAMIVTIGLSILARYVILFFLGGNIYTIDTGLTATIDIGPATITVASLVSMGVSILMLILVGLFLTRTRIGKATRAVSDNASLAAASGINVDRIIRIVWILAATLTGLSGILYGVFRQVNWSMGFQILLLLFAAVTLGGLGSAFGALVGALIIGVVTEVSTVWIPNDLRYAVALIILILVLLVRPQGVLGRKERVG